jgi:hypothetical protein
VQRDEGAGDPGRVAARPAEVVPGGEAGAPCRVVEAHPGSHHRR